MNGCIRARAPAIYILAATALYGLSLPAETLGMLTVGVDIVEIERIAQVVARRGERFLRRVYTEAEIALYRHRVPELAARFAGKEATMKALGTGVVGVDWREIEILPNRRGKPLLYLHGRAKVRAEALGITEMEVSLSHSKEYAVASVVGGSQGLPVAS